MENSQQSFNLNRVNFDRETFTILIANDSEDVRLLLQEALQEVPLQIRSFFVENGESLLDYLYRIGCYEEPSNSPRPHLILLDLQMPRLDGREALAVIKSDPNFHHLPIVILTTSYQERDILQCYRLGANSFIVKPLTFEELVKILKSLCHYWFEIVSLPPES